MLKRWCGSFYSTSERNYQTFDQMQAKSSFGCHVGGQEYVFQHGDQYKSYHFVENQSAIKYLPLMCFLSKIRV